MMLHDIDAGNPRLPLRTLTTEQKQDVICKMRDAILAA